MAVALPLCPKCVTDFFTDFFVHSHLSLLYPLSPLNKAARHIVRHKCGIVAVNCAWRVEKNGEHIFLDVTYLGRVFSEWM